MEQLDQDLAAIITGKVRVMHSTGKPGRPPDTANIIARMLGLRRKDVVRNGLNRIQTADGWLCRYSNMMYSREREKHYNP